MFEKCFNFGQSSLKLRCYFKCFVVKTIILFVSYFVDYCIFEWSFQLVNDLAIKGLIS